MNNNVIVFPPNTKDATATKKESLLIVNCPHCKGTHYHQLIDRHKIYLEANCGLGFYVIRSVDKVVKR